MNASQGSKPENQIEPRIIDNMIAKAGAVFVTEARQMYGEHPQSAHATAVLVARLAATNSLAANLHAAAGPEFIPGNL